MLHLQFLHLLYLILLLAPGIISGTIVTWKTRSIWALFVTIGFSFVGSIAIAVSTILFGKLVAPFLVSWLGSWTQLIDFSQAPVRSDYGWLGSLPFYLLSSLRYSIVAPIGTVAGATVAGMLMLVRDKLTRQGGKFDPAYGWIAGFGSAIVGGILGVCSILLLSWLGWQALVLAQDLLRSPNGYFTNFAQIAWGVAILVNGFVCGLISAICGIKLAKLLM
jgi:hypothetical protein